MSDIRWTPLTEVQTRQVQWLWEGRIPFGKVTLLDGEPGAGKSLLAIDLAARVSRGASMPLCKLKNSGPANVVIYNDDDNLADTIRPRLEAAGADLTRIRAVDGEISAEALRDIRPALIVLDPVSAYLCDEQRSPSRVAIKKLTHLARETNAAILAVEYVEKGDFWAEEVVDLARSVLVVAQLGHNRHRLTLTKSNLRNLSEISPLVFNFEPTEASVRLSGWADSV